MMYLKDLPEFRDYARQKYPDALDEDLITMIEDLIERGRGDKRQKDLCIDAQRKSTRRMARVGCPHFGE